MSVKLIDGNAYREKLDRLRQRCRQLENELSERCRDFQRDPNSTDPTTLTMLALELRHTKAQWQDAESILSSRSRPEE
jgi:hypothetical protein